MEISVSSGEILEKLQDIMPDDLKELLHEAMESASIKKQRKSELLSSILKTKNFDEERDLLIESTKEDEVFSPYPILKVPETLKEKQFFDQIVGLKIYTRSVLIRLMMRSHSQKSADKKLEKKLKSITLFYFSSDIESQGYGDIHSMFANLPCYRMLVWALKQLEMPIPKKVSDFEYLYPVEADDQDNQIQKELSLIKSITKTNIFNEHHTPNILRTYLQGLEQFENSPINELPDEKYNALSALMFGFSKIIENDLAFLSITSSAYPNSIPLAVSYLKLKVIRENYQNLLDEDNCLREEALRILESINSVAKAISDSSYSYRALSSLRVLSGFPGAILDLNEKVGSGISVPESFYNEYWIGFFAQVVDELKELNNIGCEIIDIKGMESIPQHIEKLRSTLTIAINFFEDNIIKAKPGASLYRFIKHSTKLLAKYVNFYSYDDLFSEYNSIIQKYHEEKSLSLKYIDDGDTDAAMQSVQNTKIQTEKIEAFFQETEKNLSQLINELMSMIQNEKEREIKNEQHSCQDKDESLKEEIMAKNELVSSLKKKNEDLSSKLFYSEEKLTKSHTELSSLKNLLHQKQVNNVSTIPSSIRKVLFDKYTVQDVVDCILETYQHVQVSDSFDKVVSSCEYELPQKLFKFLCLLCEDYYKAIINGTPDSEAKHILGQTFRANESETSMSNSTLKSAREFYFDGEKRLCTKHLTLGSSHNTRKTCQVYFDIEGTTLYLAYIGEHLPLS